MFNFNDKDGVRLNPLIAKELIKHLTVSEIMILYANSHPDEYLSIDTEAIVEGILETNDDGKILVLALCAKGGSHEGLQEEQILKIADRSEAHKAAILSNPRINWYSSFSLPSIREKLLVPTILGYGDLAFAACRNPRMDRNLISEVIRGANEFQCISIEHRMELAFISINVVDIESKSYYKKDMPDSNEQYFSKPIEAFYSQLKQIDNTNELKRIWTSSIQLIKCLNKNNFNIDVEDWISDSERQVIESSNVDWDVKYKNKNELAIRNFVDWAIKFAGNAPIQPEKYTAYIADDFNRSCLAVVMIRKALSSYMATTGIIKELMQQLYGCEKWVGRAAFYSLMLDKTLIYYPFNELTNLVSVPEDEKLVLLHGFLANEKYYFFRMTVGLSQLGLFFSDGIEYNVEMSDYINDCYDFGIGREFKTQWSPEMEKSEIERRLRDHNQSALNSSDYLSDKARFKMQRIIDGYVEEPVSVFFYIRKAFYYSFIGLIIYYLLSLF
jgi:hypothetical protein